MFIVQTDTLELMEQSLRALKYSNRAFADQNMLFA